MEEEDVGVVFFSERPSAGKRVQVNGQTASSVVTTFNNDTRIYSPCVETANGTVDRTVWTKWCPSKHKRYPRTILLPSIFSCGKHTLSFNKNDEFDERTMQEFDLCNMLCLTTVHDMFHHMGGLTNDQTAALDMFYAVSVSIGVDYYYKSVVSTPGDVIEHFSPWITAYELVMKESQIDRGKLSSFHKGIQMVAQTVCRSTFKVETHLVEAAIRMFAMSGLSALALQQPQEHGYTGCHYGTPDTRQLAMLAAFQNTNTLLDDPEVHSSLTKYLLNAFLYGQHGIARSLGIHAVIFDKKAACSQCGVEVSAGAVRTGIVNVCCSSKSILCPNCTPCSAATKVVDYEMAAVESASKIMEMVRKMHADRKKIEELEKELANQKNVLAKKGDEHAAEVVKLLMKKDDVIASLQAERVNTTDHVTVSA